MTSDPQLVESVQSYPRSNQVIVGDGNALSISLIGKLTLPTHKKPLHFKDILIVPQLTSNLLSIAKFVKDNYCLIEFNPFGCVVKDFAPGYHFSQATSTITITH